VAQSITFTGSRILACSYTKDGVSLKMSANLTDTICKQMKWTQEIEIGKKTKTIVGVAAFLAGAKPEGKLNGTQLEMIPTDQDLRATTLTLDISSVTGFEVVRREQEGTRGKESRQEVHFNVAVGGTGPLKRIEAYCARVGIGKLSATAKASVSYEKQEEIELLISPEQAQETLKDD